MGIFDILFRNTGQKARTLRPDEQSLPEGFRGKLDHTTDICIGCKTCAYVCSPGAIRLAEEPEGIVWQYQAERCTFCGRCAEYCPTGAINLDRSIPQAPRGIRSTQPARHLVEYQRCARCGQPYLALPAPILAKLTGQNIEPGANEGFDLDSLARLCEKCRSRVTSQRIKDSLAGIIKGKLAQSPQSSESSENSDSWQR
jgi:ferredoxin